MTTIEDLTHPIAEAISEKRGQAPRLWSIGSLVSMTRLSGFGYGRKVYTRAEIEKFQQHVQEEIYNSLRKSFSEADLALEVEVLIHDDHTANIAVKYVWH